MGKISAFKRPFHLLIIAILLCGAASATTVTISGLDTNNGESIWLSLDGVDTQLDFAGVLFITVATGTDILSRTAFCVDVFTDITAFQTYNTDVLSPSDLPGLHL